MSFEQISQPDDLARQRQAFDVLAQQGSDELKASGVAARVIDVPEDLFAIDPGADAMTFRPVLSKTPLRPRVSVLRMVVGTQAEVGTHYSYTSVAEVSEEDGTLQPFEGIRAEDATALWGVAKRLIAARADGTLPNLRKDLFEIEQPDTEY